MTKNRVRVLFYIRDKKINVYEYKNCKFESIQDCGEDEIEYSDNFMNWFKGAIAYLKEMQELDYLVITDNSVDLDFSEFNIVNQSFWNKESIKEFNISKLSSQGLILKNLENKEYYRFNANQNTLEYTVIFCDKNLQKNIKEKKNKGVKLPKREDKINLEVKLQDKNINLQKTEIDSKKTVNESSQKKVIPKEKPLNKRVNIAEYFKEKLRKEEEERMKIKSKF